MMHSLWTVSYAGPHYGVFMKKLARVMDIRMQDIETQRTQFKGEKISYSSFVLEHDAGRWEELLAQTLQTAQSISCRWELSIGCYPIKKNHGTGEKMRVVSGSCDNCRSFLSDMRSVTWKISESQD